MTRSCILLPLLLAGCGGLTNAPPSAEPSEKPDVSAEQDASAPETLPPATAEGLIAISYDDTSTRIFPLFRDRIVPPTPGRTWQQGECRVLVESDLDDSDTFESNASAGTFRAHAGERSVELEYDEARKSYDQGTFPGVGTLSPDVPLEIEASGADVPAFHTTVQLLRPLRVLTSTEAGIAKGKPFTLNWERTSEDVGVNITIAGEARRVMCFVNGALGSFEIAADYLESVTDHPLPSDVVTLDLLAAKTTALRAGAYEVHVLDNRPVLHASLALH